MSHTLRKSLMVAFMLGAVAFGQTDASAALGACPMGATATLADFPPYKYELRPEHSAQLDALASKIASTMSTKVVKRVRIIGHAALYGTSDFAKTARYRASVVEAELKSRLGRRGIDYSKITFESSGMSTDCPVDTNSTQAGRAKNRRVDVWIETAGKPPPPPPPPKVKKITTRDALISLRSSTSNPTTQCLAGKVLDGAADHDFLPDDGLNAFISAPLQKVGSHGYTSFERDLKDWLNDQVRRIRDVRTSEADQARFNKSFLRAQRSLLDGIADLEKIDCYDKRKAPVRRYILEQTKRKSSLYSCPVVKKQVEDLMKALGGVNGCTRY